MGVVILLFHINQTNKLASGTVEGQRCIKKKRVVRYQIHPGKCPSSFSSILLSSHTNVKRQAFFCSWPRGYMCHYMASLTRGDISFLFFDVAKMKL